MRYAIGVGLLLSLGLLGCGNGGNIIDEGTIVKTIEIAAEQGAYQGLKQWNKENPDAAMEAAQALSRNLKEKVIPFLDGEAELKSSDEVNEFINSSLFKDVPDTVKNAITAAAAVLDLYLPIPGADNLDEKHRKYLRAFVSGLQKGAARFNGSLSDVGGERHWITGKSGDSAQASRKWIAG